ncbi:hypothetical protein JOF56_011449 [Kibdelosporangium banguiense]|uniref:Uncharacterized protein n=1 Tax=Kibdelosporangium banguiense TaxID=1365924 RepID=A0ABS4U316_9PSEU|nr:hypothetical protein [Kibdelosporangium banguiense]MBP2331064.1 hypothetical protein [Kibdelosporangium banguiense]
MATNTDHFSRGYPIQADELRYKNDLPVEAGWLITELTNAAAARFGQLSTFFYELMSWPDKPSWLLATPEVRKAKDAARREGGKRLGRSANKLPDWQTVSCVAKYCLPESERQEILPRWAGWWMSYQKDSTARPPGYTGPVNSDGIYLPPLADPAQAPDVATCVRLFQRERVELEKKLEQTLVQLVAVRYELANREAELVRTLTDRDELRQVHQAIATELSLKDSQIAQLSATITSLKASRDRVAAVHEARAHALRTELAEQTVAAQQSQETELETRQNTALILAHCAGLPGGPASGENVLPVKVTARAPALDELLRNRFAPTATPSARRLAAYLRAHLTMAAVPNADLAARGVSGPELASLLRARQLPSTKQLDALIDCCPLIAEHGRILLDEARAGELIEKFAGEPRQVTVAELLARHRDNAPVEPVPPAARDAGFVSIPGLRIMLLVMAVSALAGLTVYACSALSAGPVTVRHERGTKPAERAAIGDVPGAFIFYEVDASPRSSTFRLETSGSARPTGLTGTLRLEHAAACSPAVAVQLLAMGTRQAIALTDGRPADLTGIQLPYPAGAKVVLIYQRVDDQPCSTRLVWDNPGAA